MSNRFARVGAIFYLLWGLIHVAGGLLMFGASSSGMSSYLTVLMGEQHGFTNITTNSELATLATKQVFAYHAYNLTWSGVLVSIVAVVSNWKNQAGGFWLNLGLVGLIDLGLILFMVVPGVIPATDPWWLGVGLFALAAIFSSLGIRRHE